MAKTKQNEVTIDRRAKSDRRESDDRRTKNVSVDKERRSGTERRDKVQRRRQIDPTTCERDYTEDEIEFMQAMDAYKRANGRMFPTCSEILEVLRDLGYEKVDKSAAEATEPVSAVAEDFAAEEEEDLDALED